MGVPHLYTHLRPYARPEHYANTSDKTPIPLYIDGPGLAYHVYNLVLCSTPLAGGGKNPWECAIEYTDFSAAVLKYLRRLEECGFDIKKIYFDGHLPYSKRPVRLERLGSCLSKLQTYYKLHPSVRSSKSQQQRHIPNVLEADSPYSPRVSPLSAPPFIVGVTIEALGRSRFAEQVRTVPGEADSFCARDAVEYGGIVLTGDSDLLLFSSSSERKEWGVIMFKDLTFSFSPPTNEISATAVTFMPEEVSRVVGVDLKMFAWESINDSHASFNVLRERVKRIVERRKTGAGVDGGRRWREFVEGYELPAFGEPVMVAEPRIAEVLNRRGGKGELEVFLPFLWEDPTRSSAWDVGREFRSYAYSALVGEDDGSGIKNATEFVRRGNRIAATSVSLDTESLTLECKDTNWYINFILESLLSVYAARNQSPPNRKALEAAAWMLSCPSSSPSSSTETPKFNWELIHFYSQLQAGFYSLLMLKQFLLLSPSSNKHQTLPPLPPVSRVINTRNLLSGHHLATSREKQLVAQALAKYHVDLAAAREIEDKLHQDGEMDVELAEESAEEAIPDNKGKRRSSEDEGEIIKQADSKLAKRRKNKLHKSREKGDVEAAVSTGNMFAALAGE
ncbi:hypothetical protein RUND412_005930 [Rhizina undulata]